MAPSLNCNRPLHPLSSMRTEELMIASQAVKAYNPQKEIAFRRMNLVEPRKAEIVPYLEAELAGARLPYAPRRYIQALFYFKHEQNYMEATVDVQTRKVVGQRVLHGMHGPADDEEIGRMAEIAMADALVKEEIKRLQLPEGSEIVAEPWPYGQDDTKVRERLFEVFFFLNLKEEKDHPSACFYAHPLPFAAVLKESTSSVIRIDYMPTGTELEAKQPGPWQPNPASEYAPEFHKDKMRKDFKPINVSQPQGVSFVVEADGETVRWQKWRFVVNFDWREGMILRNVTYDGRPVFYRLALSEMTVPYGDGRSPYHRKSAYDLGEGGAGSTANNLQLGCDCLGVIHYFDGLVANSKGEAVKMPNAVCMHEVDGGLGWKHTNVRTGRADIVRNRELVLQQIMTIANYEYALYWVFDTMGTLSWEVRATGIMSVTAHDLDAKAEDYNYGTIVHPGVFAPHHQHIFNLRVDPAIDGYRTTDIIYDEVRSNKRGPANPHGVSFGTHTTAVTREGAFDLDWTTNRTVKLINKQKINPVSGKPVGFKIAVPPTQLGLADVSSMHNARGEFVDHHIHVTKQSDREMYAAGDHPWQSVGDQAGCKTWAKRGRRLENDGVVWVTIGFTHVTRPEDFPVMPADVFRMHFKPVGFFTANPSLDVPPSRQAENKSVRADCCEKAKPSGRVADPNNTSHL